MGYTSTNSRGRAIYSPTIKDVEDELLYGQALRRKDGNPFRRSYKTPDSAEAKHPLYDQSYRSVSASNGNGSDKAVFEYISITPSLSTKVFSRNKSRAVSQQPQAAFDIPLQNIFARNNNSPRVDTAPPILPALPPQSNSIFNNIKSALASMSSPINRDGLPNILPVSSKGHRIDGEDMEESPQFAYSHGGDAAPPSTSCGEPDYWNEEENELVSSLNYPGNDYSIYHSNLGAAPSGSAPLSSRFGESPGNQACLIPYRVASTPSHLPSSQPQKLDFQSSLSGVGSIQTWPRKSSKLHKDSTGESMRDESTITNIYKQYASDVEGDSRVDRIRDSPRFYPHSRQTQKRFYTASATDEHPTSRPPTIDLPTAPSHIVKSIPISPSQGIGHSSSYGDTRNLLDITPKKPTMTRSEGRCDLRSDYGVSDSNKPGQAEEGDEPLLHTNNPFRASQSPNVIISTADGEEHAYTGFDKDRLPLERDISKALRRASGYSSYSIGSVSSSILDYGNGRDETRAKGISPFQRPRYDDTPPSESENLDDDTCSSAIRAEAFYKPSVVAETYRTTHQHAKVRIRIERNELFPESPPVSPNLEEVQGKSQHTSEDDHHDWETVGESVLGQEIQGTRDFPGMLGGTACRAGSSIANASDDGAFGEYIPEISAFDSTDRIAQHPAAMGHASDYRQVDLKHTNQPLLLPLYGDYKVNGYPADSMRTRPSPNLELNYTPQVLNKSHKNPFNSTPPDVLRSSSVQPRFNYRSQRLKPNHFPATRMTAESGRNQNGTMTSLASTAEHPDEDDFGEPGPAIKNNHLTFDSDEHIRPNSEWLRVMQYADGGSWPESGENGSPDGKAGPVRTVDGGLQKPEKAFAQDHDGKQFVKGPPGAFYHGLQGSHPGHDEESRKGHHKGSLSRNGKESRRSRHRGPREYPTNSLRPLSMLSSSASTMTIGEQPRQRGEFIYRSPIAPVKRPSWSLMYSKEERRQQAERAVVDGFTAPGNDNISTVPPATCRSSVARLNDPATLFLPRQGGSITCNLVLQKHKFSKLVFGLCNLFPPLLGLYAYGYLDNVMIAWSKGEFDTFPRRYKKWSARAMFLWMIVVILGLAIGLGVYFSRLKST